jgi:cytochrome P450
MCSGVFFVGVSHAIQSAALCEIHASLELMNSSSIITNAAPMLTWLVTALLTHPEFLQEFRSKAEQYISGSEKGPVDIKFDIPSFCAEPFIQGVWKEALRLGVTSASARVVTRDSEIEGYTVKKGSVLLLPTRNMHFEERVFHHPYEFNPWRWLPLDEKSSSPSTFGQVSSEQLRRQNNSLRPFGGGTGVCSGRFIAEQEVMMAAAVLLHLFEFEFEQRQSIPCPNLNPQGLAAMYPIVDPKVIVSRRRTVRM